MTKLTEWLKSIDGIKDVKPTKVIIHNTSYEAAQYNQHGDERLYCIGKLPACYIRSTHTVFLFPNDHRDWYVASFITARHITEAVARFHPFGETFILIPWTAN